MFKIIYKVPRFPDSPITLPTCTSVYIANGYYQITSVETDQVTKISKTHRYNIPMSDVVDMFITEF